MQGKVTHQWTSGALPLKTGRATKFLMLNDVHVPLNIPLDSIFDFLKEFKPDYVLLNGDIMNMSCFSHWERAKPARFKEMPDPTDEYAAAQKSFFTPLRKAASAAKLVYILGNHEAWYSKAMEQMPEGRGYWEPWNNLTGIDAWVKQMGVVNLGKLHFLHGDVLPGLPRQHATRMVQLFRRNVRYGHAHDIQEASFKSPVDHHEMFTARSCGTLQKFNPDFMRSQPHDWVHAFTFGYVQPDGSFQDSTVHVSETGHFAALGKSY